MKCRPETARCLAVIVLLGVAAVFIVVRDRQHEPAAEKVICEYPDIQTNFVFANPTMSLDSVENLVKPGNSFMIESYLFYADRRMMRVHTYYVGFGPGPKKFRPDPPISNRTVAR